LATAEFAFNNNVYTATKSSLFKVNYKKELRMGFDIRKKKKHVKVEEFVKEMKNRYEEIKAVLVKLQKEMKRYVDTKDFPMELIKRATKKLMEKYIGSYVVKKIISENMVELELLVSLRTHPVVNMRRIVKYQE